MCEYNLHVVCTHCAPATFHFRLHMHKQTIFQLHIACRKSLHNYVFKLLILLLCGVLRKNQKSIQLNLNLSFFVNQTNDLYIRSLNEKRNRLRLS